MTTSKRSTEVVSQLPHPGQDLRRCHARPGGPRRVVRGDHERTPVDTDRSQVPAEFRADDLVPAGEDDLEKRLGRGCAEAGRAAWASTRRPDGDLPCVPPALMGGLKASYVERRGHGDPLGSVWPSSGSTGRRATPPRGHGCVPDRARRTRRRAATSVPAASGPDQRMHAEAQRQGQAALFALGGVRACLPSVDLESVGRHDGAPRC